MGQIARGSLAKRLEELALKNKTVGNRVNPPHKGGESSLIPSSQPCAATLRRPSISQGWDAPRMLAFIVQK